MQVTAVEGITMDEITKRVLHIVFLNFSVKYITEVNIHRDKQYIFAFFAITKFEVTSVATG